MILTKPANMLMSRIMIAKMKKTAAAPAPVARAAAPAPAAAPAAAAEAQAPKAISPRAKWAQHSSPLTGWNFL